MNYARFDHVNSDEDAPDNDRFRLEAAADVIPPPLREALGKMHIALEYGDDAAAMHARNSMGQMIRALSEVDRPKVMAAIQRVVVGTSSSNAQITKNEKAMPKQQEKATAMPKPAPAVPEQAVEASRNDSAEGARRELSRAVGELEAAQKELSALDPSNTVRAQGSNRIAPVFC